MRILIAVAHADDEMLGGFSLLTSPEHEAGILHATNSTPHNPRYALKAGYSTHEAYQAARREEMLAALQAAGLDPQRHWRALDGIADQDSPNHIAAIREAALSYGADRIYTHAYEGGHPDHDALAFALQGLPNVWEFPLYHASAAGDLVLAEFLEGKPTVTVELTAGQVQHKRRILECFRSQQSVIGKFPIEREYFRPMREYDFSKPPHAGQLYYELRQHGWVWPDWRKAVSESAPSPQ